MSTAIVQMNVTQTSAPAPSVQQKKGTFVSQGGTTLTPGTAQLLQSASDLTGILKGTLAISTISWSGGTATVATAAPHGIPTGDTVQVTISGATPSGYNGTFQATATDTTHFTYPLVGNPGAISVPGVWTPEDVAELVAMNTTFWAQGSSTPVYVLELGLDGTPQGVTALNTYINNNTVNGLGPFYAYLLPRAWAGEATLPAFLNNFNALNKKTYFFVTATNANYTNFTNLMKCTSVMIEAAGIPATEFDHAADFWALLSTSPSAANKVSQFRYRFMLGVTAYPQPSNGSIIDTYLSGSNNLILTGAEAQLANTLLRNGTFKDGRDYLYWYAVDWTQLNGDIDLSAAVVNGSQPGPNPLYYNQPGINRLQAVLANTIARGVSFGLIFGAPIMLSLDPATFVANVQAGKYAGLTPINAQPFIPYVTANQADFAAGNYNGLQFAMTPNRGFAQLIVNMNVTDLVAGG